MNNSKFSVLLFSFIFLSGAMAAAASKTVLHVPLFVEVTSGVQPNPKYEYVPVAEFNKVLVQYGQKAQPEFVDVSLDSQVDLSDVREAMNAAIDAAGIKDVQAFGEYVPANWGDDKNYTCYRGNGRDVVNIVTNNAGILYSDQYTLFGWKLGKNTTIVNANEDASFDSEAWNQYDKNSDSVLLLASVTDDGTDENASLIPRCK